MVKENKSRPFPLFITLVYMLKNLIMIQTKNVCKILVLYLKRQLSVSLPCTARDMWILPLSSFIMKLYTNAGDMEAGRGEQARHIPPPPRI
jgi:hypothetical protein